MLLTDLNPGVASSIPTDSTSLATLGDSIFTAANEGVTGEELWAYGRVSLELYGVPRGGSVSITIGDATVGVQTEYLPVA